MIAAPPPPKTISSFALPAGVRTLKLADTDISHLKLMSCYFTMLGVTLFWLVTLTKYAQKPGCLPWCLTFTFVSLTLAIQLFLEQIRRTQAPLQYSTQRESRCLAETLTAAYALTSLAICTAFMNTQWYKIDRTVLTQQIIEIDLSLATNSIDKHIPLAKQTFHTAQNMPAAKIAAVSRVNVAARHAASFAQRRAQSTAAARPAAAAQPSVAAHIVAARTIAAIHTPAPVTASTPARQPPLRKAVVTPLSSALPLTPLGSAVPRATRSRRNVPQVSTGSSFFMEEVPPAQLVEVRETENSKAAALRSPTSSPGMAVNMSVLAEYLRELHHVIKAAWTPPRDNTRSAEIIFRIKRSGELALVKVVRSSGDSDSDESAINAITASAPFKPLPAAYSLPSLDVDYTFNYTSDRLTEVGSGYH